MYIALIGFLVHLALIYISELGLFQAFSKSELMNNPISAVYTPFSFILVYEVYLLIYYLPRSFTTYITKQYEIITLIIIRKLFKDLSLLELSTNWFEIKGDLQFTYDILASVVLFFLIFLIGKYGKRRIQNRGKPHPKVLRFIRRKRIIATLLVPTFFSLALYTFIDWIVHVNPVSEDLPSFSSINGIFFDEFFMVLIIVDIILLLISLFHTDQFHKIIRNSGFIVSTILIRLSFGTSGLVSTLLIVLAVLFGLLIILIHNQYEKEQVG